MAFVYKPSAFMLPDSHYDKDKADRAVAFIEHLCHTKGKWAGQPFLLLPWQEQIVRDLFGIVKENGKRQFLTAYIEIPKKNGKSELAAAIALYLLYADNEPSAEVYGAACDRNQASIVFDVARQMVEMSPALMRRSKIRTAGKRIINYRNAGFYQVLSAETGTKHGLNVSGLVFDEIHAQPNRHLYDVLTKGSGDAREQPLFFIITTAGNDKNSICYELHTKALDLMAGRKKDYTFYPVVYGFENEADWTDEANWYKANPSLGHTIQIDRVREAYRNAIENPAEENVFKQLMTEGIRVAGGDRIGKTIIFAQNKEHAKFIVECFDKLYPQYKGKWAARVVCGDAKVESLIDDFKNPDKAPYIAVSVDMLDTGIDVPEIVNLVFFKKVRSKTKFLQMIGRGTRLCPGLGCIDAKNGEYEDKKYFYIFDYCMNFEYFSEDRNDIDTSRIEGLTEKIFNKRIQLCSIFQNAKYVDYGDWRKELVNICHGQIKALPRDSFIVHNELRFVEKFSDIKKFDVLSKTDIAELESHISPIVTTDDIDEAAKRFDNFMYGLMIVLHEEGTVPPNQISHLQDIATRLLDRITIEAIKKKISLLQRICDDDFWNNYSMMTFENIRKEIRDLVQYIVDIHSVRKIKTDLEDPIESIVHRDNPYMPKEPKPYRERVESYFLEHKDRTAVRKLIENEPLTAEDHRELQKIFTEELGTEKEYHNAYHDQDFGIVVRSIAKMDPAAAERAFSKFINDYHPNNRQLQFIKKVIQYLAVNGNMQSDELFDPPFDRPDSLADIFNFEQKSRIVAIINSIYNNARNINNGAA